MNANQAAQTAPMIPRVLLSAFMSVHQRLKKAALPLLFPSVLLSAFMSVHQRLRIPALGRCFHDLLLRCFFDSKLSRLAAFAQHHDAVAEGQ